MTRDIPNESRQRRRLFGRPLNERGAIAVQVAVMLVVLLALVSLGVEITLVLVKHRQIQTTADDAAMAGAAALALPASADTEAKAVSAAHGFVNGQAGTVVTVNNPPLSGPHTADNKYVEVIISQPQPVVLAKLLRPGDFDVGGRAVAALVSTSGTDFCMLGLQKTGYAVEIMNNVNLANPTCGIASDSTSAGSVYLHNNAIVSGPISAAGTIWRDNGAATTGTPIVENGPGFADPYKVDNGTPPVTCLTQSGTTLNPGHYCSGLNISGTLNLNPGTYWIDTKFVMANGAKLIGTGVTVIINGNYAIKLGNNYTLQLQGQTSGTYKGIAMMGASTTYQDQQFDNGGVLSIKGAIYFPNQKLHFFNNLDTSGSNCIQLIALRLQFENNVGFNYNCTGFPINPIGSVTARLAE